MPGTPPSQDSGLDRTRYLRQIREQVRVGEYRVDPRALADRMALALLGCRPGRAFTSG
jgi:anti-sigma28 factor (negative regulator of flagellin synthesis)